MKGLGVSVHLISGRDFRYENFSLATCALAYINRPPISEILPTPLVCVCVREREHAECVCVYVCVREREKERACRVCERERKRGHAYTCACCSTCKSKIFFHLRGYPHLSQVR